ncbi:hypothetical protein IVA80_06965 [Bradyrhizobium sp. 139]|uniref:hypothetical protein n=1 Tax=Bradyrhizobium sp. 139 TaxID=2782616 RepID=UPI001FFA971B|nr:hypothetical protein [Bradyrhizobium sp. 139]MCK1740617.1 hypothetical protein [Bradyrhizobium sp. 139]
MDSGFAPRGAPRNDAENIAYAHACLSKEDMKRSVKLGQNAPGECRAAFAVVPGSCFGLAPYFRLSYATSEQNLREATERIAKACMELS